MKTVCIDIAVVREKSRRQARECAKRASDEGGIYNNVAAGNIAASAEFRIKIAFKSSD